MPNNCKRSKATKESYPANLLIDIFGKDYCEENDFPKDIETALDYMISTLSEREAAVMNARYRERKTLEEAGSIIGVKRERARQITARALRKLCHPSRTMALKCGLAAYIKSLKDRVEKLEEQVRDLRIENGKLKEKNIVFKDVSICCCGFSARTYNALCRAGINTLYDLIKYRKTKGLAEIEGLGKKGYEELAEYLWKLAENDIK